MTYLITKAMSINNIDSEFHILQKLKIKNCLTYYIKICTLIAIAKINALDWA